MVSLGVLFLSMSSGFILIIVFVREATKEGVLSLEQAVLDGCVCVYNILPTAGSSAGHTLTEEQKTNISAARKGMKFSEEHKARISESVKGEKNPRFNKGKPVYLYVVHPHGLELQSTHFNGSRLAEFLGIDPSQVY